MQLLSKTITTIMTIISIIDVYGVIGMSYIGQISYAKGNKPKQKLKYIFILSA